MTELNEVKLKFLLDLKIEFIKTQVQLNNESNIDSRQTLKEETSRLLNDIKPNNLDELKKRLREIEDDKTNLLRANRELINEVKNVFYAVKSSKSEATDALSTIKLKLDDNQLLKRLSKKLFLEEIMLLVQYVYKAQTSDGDLNFDTNNSLYYLIHETDWKVIKALAEHFTCTSLNLDCVLLELVSKKHARNALLNNLGSNNERPKLNPIIIVEAFGMKMKCYLSTVRNLIFKSNDAKIRLRELFEHLEFQRALPIDAYVPRNPSLNYASYAQLKQEFDGLYKEVTANK